MSDQNISTLSSAKRALLQQRMLGGKPASARPPVVARERKGPAPLSSAQEQLWYYSQLAPDNPVYNEVVTIRKEGAFDADAFERAFNEIVRRHEAWRSTFAVVDGKPMQIPAAVAHYELPVIDLRHLPPGEREHEAAMLAVEDSRRAYDLTNGPLIRPRLVRLSGNHHRLYLSMHHLIFDGVTLYRIVLPELISLYDAFAAGRPSPLADPPIQYADYAVWEQASAESAEVARRLDYWRHRLSDAPTLQLPLDRSRPARQRFRGGMERIHISKELADGLRALSKQTGASLFQVIASAFAVLLHGYSGQDDVVFGTLVDLRRRPELEGMVGYCLTPLVLRVDVCDDPPFTDLLTRVRRDLLDALDNLLSFGQLVRELHPKRDPGANPFFGAMVVLEPPMDTSDPSWSIHQMELEVGSALGHAKLDLHIELDERPEGHVAGRLIYNTDIFEAKTARRAVGHWHTLLESIAADSTRSISQLGMLTDEEQRQFLVEWNHTAADYPRESCVHELVAAQVERTPDAEAVACGDERVTFLELDRRANAIAHFLKEAGARTGSVVAICVDRSVDMVAGMLGIWKSGAAYLPLDPHYPTDRLAFMLEDSGATVLLTHSGLLPVLPEHHTTVICLDDDRFSAGADASGPGTDVAQPGNADDLAYVLYTSGSTGKPKGVQVQHRAVVNLLTSMAQEPGMGPRDVVVAVTTYAFDIAVVELWLPLVTGARTVIAPRAVASDGRRLAKLITDAGATVMQATPSGWQLLIDSGWSGQPGLVALCGGEALPEQLAEALLDRTAAVWNMYGPTETTVWSTTVRLEKGAPVTIGCPIANTRVYVLDRHRQLVPAGVDGELWIGGDGVTRGYLHRPEETAERFVDDPFLAGGRMYRTGDLVRWRSDGKIQYLGRLDHQVKVRGFRIEPGEIQTALLAHEGIASAVVVAREDTPGDRRLVAYVVPKGEPPTSAQLGELLRRTLPDYMVPAAFVTLDTLPLTPNSKVDRKALPPPEWKPVSTPPVAPRTAVEERLATIWARILHVDRVGVNDDFFELGGHSLLAVRLLVEVEREFGVRIELIAMFEGGLSVAGMAALLDAAHSGHAEGSPSLGITGAGATPPVTPRGHTGPAPLSAAEAQLWYFTQLAPGNPVYTGAFVIHKRGSFEVGSFRAALNEIVRRHEILRSTFELVDGEPVQVVHPAGVLELPLVDLGSLPAHQREREADSLAAADARRPYQVDRGPLIRPRLIQLAEDCHRLDLAMHHLVYDATSLGILMSELVSLYEAFAAGRASPLSDPTVQYADYATWEREWTASALFANRLDYWRRRLDDVPALHLALDRPRPPEQRFRGATERFSVPLELVDHLRSISREYGSTISQAMASAFAVLLHRYSGQEDVVFGTVADQRERPELHAMVGYCVTPLVIRADMSGNPTFIDVLRRVRGELLGAMTHQVPFERLVRELQPPREPGANPYFQAVVVMQPGAVHPADSWEMHPLDIELGDGYAEAQFDLTMYLDEHPDGHFDGRLVYDIDLFKSETARRMVDHWSKLLASIATESQRAVSELSMLSEGELHQQLMEWNSTDTEYPRDACVHELVADQVHRTPAAIAVTDGRTELSYAQLNEHAGRLATHLRENGVGPDMRVGVCLDRSLDLVVALLAVLKAGGAFVPLEPDQPQARLAHMVNDAGPRVVLTTARLEASLPPTEALLVRLDAERESWMTHPASSTGDCTPSNLAYVLFTSGSTGTPKGVMIEHRSLVNQLVWRTDSFKLGPGDRVLQKTPFGFDVSLWELFCPLIAGATMVLLEPGAQGDPVRLAAAIRSQRITALHFVPSMLQAFLAADVRGCDSVRLVASSGEALSAGLAQRFFECFGPEVELRNLYGPTEAAVDVTSWRCDPGGEAVVPIGRPVANTQIYLLGADDRPVPVGVAGELCIGGVQVARGYLNRPELTAERFVANPFRAGERIYRTGDRARYRNDGTVEYLGRSDDQVKVRGFRIELGEIETALLAHEGIASAVVVAREDTPGDRRLVAYVVPKGEPPTSARLGELLRRTLPDYMVPAAFVTLDTLPLTPNGKVDRKALPPPEWKPVSTTPVAPRTAVEERLATIWARILHVDRVGVNDDFFELGGHSLLAVRLLVEMQREFGVEVPLTAFLKENGTVAGLATAIEATREAHVTDPLTISVQPHGTTPILFFIHVDESGMLTLRHFIEPLGLGQRVMGLLPERRGRRFDRSRSLEELASPMLVTIRQSQPHGPYFLAGYSMGGLLAYEVAGRLQAAGEQVGWLGLLDAGTPADGARYQQQRLSLRQRLARQRERGARGAARKTYQVALRELRAALVRLGLRRSEMTDEFDWRGASALVARYACPPNDVAMDLFVCDDSAERGAGAVSDSLGWAELHKGVLRVHRFEGDHRAMVTDPLVTLVAETFSRSLREAVRASQAN